MIRFSNLNVIFVYLLIRFLLKFSLPQV